MSAAWMLYAAAVAGLAGAAALLVERALRLFGLPQRGVWALALAASLVLPLALPSVRAAAPATEAGAAGQVAVVDLTGAVAALPAGAERGEAWTGRALVAGWAAGTVGVVGWLLGSSLLLVRARRRWRRGRVGKSEVLVSADTGPAVVGFVRPQVVLPEWVLEWDEDRQRLIVEHEREHIRARDPLLLLAGLLAVAMAPWNIPLWWQLRRLRLAVEVDCDRRLLRRAPDVRDYGLLLLEVGRRSAGRALAVAAFSEPASFLERRIRVMTSPRKRNRVWLAAGLLGVAAAVPVALYALPAPGAPRLLEAVQGASAKAELPTRPEAAPAAPRAEFDTVPARGDTAAVEVARLNRKPELQKRHMIGSVLQRHYPPMLKDAGIEGQTMVQFVIGRDGRVEPGSVSAVSSTHAQFADAAVRAVREFEFAPGRLNGEAVRTRIQIPITWKPRSPAPAESSSSEGVELDRKPELLDINSIGPTMMRHYPPALRAAGVGGVVTAEFVVAEDGRVDPSTIRIVESPHEELSEASRGVLLEFRFRPGERAGQPVRSQITIPLRWWANGEPGDEQRS